MADGMRRLTRIFALATLPLAPLLSPHGARAEMADPTRPPPGYADNAPAGAQPREPALAVSSLFLMGSRPYAVVDGQIVHIGDRLAAGRVSRIDAQGVWLHLPGPGKKRDGQRLLRLLPEVDKRPSRNTEMPAGTEKKVEKR